MKLMDDDYIKRREAIEIFMFGHEIWRDYEAVNAIRKIPAANVRPVTEMFDERDKQMLMEIAKSLPLQIIPNKDEKPCWIPAMKELSKEEI